MYLPGGVTISQVNMTPGTETHCKTNKWLSSYQTSVAVIKAKLSGYIPVCVFLNDGHIRVLDRAAEMIKLQLQTGGFLYV